VKPVLQQHCLKCHGTEAKVKGGLNLATRTGALAGGDAGPAFDVVEAVASRLLKAIGYADDALKMPLARRKGDADLFS